MKNFIGKIRSSFLCKLSVSALGLGLCAKAFALNFAAIPADPAPTPYPSAYTYTGSYQGQAACNTTYKLFGYKPVDLLHPNATYPLFLVFYGSGDTTLDPNFPAGYDGWKTIAQQMAARGFVSLIVQYDNVLDPSYPFGDYFNEYSLKSPANAQGIGNKLSCMFDANNANYANSMIVKACALDHVNCSTGIATWGHSQGAEMALGSSRYESRVKAAVAMGYSGYPPYSCKRFDGVPLSCVSPLLIARYRMYSTDERTRIPLAPERIRLLNGVDDAANVPAAMAFWAGSPTSVSTTVNDSNANVDTNHMNIVVGTNCPTSVGTFGPSTWDQCLRANGSGWVVVHGNRGNTSNPSNTVDNQNPAHCWFGKSDCNGSTPGFETTFYTTGSLPAGYTQAPYSMLSTADWLSSMIPH